MSRFWAEEGSTSEDEDEDQQPQSAATGLTRNTAYAMSDSDSEEDVRRKVVSKRDKYTADLEEGIKKLKNHLKIDDWKSVAESWADVQARAERAEKTMAKANNNEGVTAVKKHFVKALIMMSEDCETSFARKKELNMHKDNQRALIRIRQGVKKMVEHEYKDAVEAQKAAPESEDEFIDEEGSESEDDDSSSSSGSGDDSSEGEEEDDDDDEDKKKPAKPAAKPKAKASSDDSDSDSGSSEWQGSDDESSSDDEAPAVGKRGTREFWLLRPDQPKTTSKPVAKPSVKPAGDKPGLPEPGSAPAPVAEVTWTPKMVDAELEKIIAERGRKGVNKLDQVKRLEDLCTKVKTETKKIEVMVHIISCLFDTGANMLVTMDAAVWEKTAEYIGSVLDLLQANPGFKLLESQDFGDDLTEDDLQAATASGTDEEETTKPVRANLLGFLERLDDELTKSYQSIDPQTKEYTNRLQSEKILLELAAKVQGHYETLNQPRPMAASARRRVEHLYYRTATIRKVGGEAEQEFLDLFETLCVLVYRHGDERTKARTMLCHIYHESQKGDFFKARDMLLMSHLQDSIHLSDVNTQILFNRTMVQLGLCAFYHGLILEAHNCLSEVLAGSRVKELLAQGITSSRYADRNPEQEKEERRRQMPYHMHINLELLECIHLVCAMLLEVPNMAETPLDMSKRKLISKSFRRTLDHMDRQLYSGPPESTRDFVMAASKSLMRGDWKKCKDLVFQIKILSLIPNKDRVLELLHAKIQEEGLRTYLFTYSSYYESLSLDQLCVIFELQPNVVHSIVSKMMINEELHASWDQPTNCIVMNQVEPTRLQSLALQFADKAATFVENNEKLLDFRTGGYGFKYDNKEKRDRPWEDRQQWDRERNYSRRNGGGGYRRDRDYNYDRGNSERHNRDNRNGDRNQSYSTAGRRW